MYPSLLKKDNTFFIYWVTFNKLFTSYCENNGQTWCEPSIGEYSIKDDFVRSAFLSNYKDDLGYNINHVFSTSNEVGILGI